MSLGFIIVRHVNSVETNNYWQEAYTCIRKYYDYPILIVDDNSDPNFLTSDLELVNCHGVKGDAPGAGEILGYYYFHLFKPFDRAVIIHDSVFIQQRINFEIIDDCAFLWTFTHQWDMDEPTLELISKLDQAEEIATLYQKKADWSGCFGIMSVITWEFLDAINTRHHLFETMLERIRDRLHRMYLERIFACVVEANMTGRTPSILGNIHQYCQWGRTFANYKRGENAHLPVIKVWTGR